MIGEGPARKVVVSAVDTNTGNYMTFNEIGIKELFASHVRSSASIPFVFPHVDIDNMVLMDGGTVFNLNLISAVERCREIVDNDSQITLDIVTCSSYGIDKASKVNHTLSNYMRYWDLSNYF